MNQLSLAARTMLGRRPRRQTLTEREAIIEQIIRAGLPVFEPIVAFQIQYGGIKYTIRGSVEGFSFDLFEGFSPNEPWEFDAFQEEQGYCGFCCGEDAWAPFHFYIRQDGAICVDASGDILLPLATSVEKYVESDAMRAGLMDIQAKWYEFFFEIADTDRSVDTVLAQGMEIVDVASDAYVTWWADDRSRIVRRRMLMVDARNRVTAYFTSHAAATRLAQTVSPILGKVPEIFSYPYDPEERQVAYRRNQQLRERKS